MKCLIGQRRDEGIDSGEVVCLDRLRSLERLGHMTFDEGGDGLGISLCVFSDSVRDLLDCGFRRGCLRFGQ